MQSPTNVGSIGIATSVKNQNHPLMITMKFGRIEEEFAHIQCFLALVSILLRKILILYRQKNAACIVVGTICLSRSGIRYIITIVAWIRAAQLDCMAIRNLFATTSSAGSDHWFKHCALN